MKLCTKCGEYKEDSAFSIDRSKRDGLYSRCRACNKENKKKYYTKFEVYRQGLWSRYRLPTHMFEKMLIEQSGLCAICSTQMVDLHIDHNHACCPGKFSCGNCVRSLLCVRCNTGLGNYRDSVEFLQEAIYYLNRHSGVK